MLSRWNFTPSPGWTKEEAQILKLCLMKYGVGRWVQILDTGLLPGKLIQQLNGQTQRLIGQQSLAGTQSSDWVCFGSAYLDFLFASTVLTVEFAAAYTGLQVDIDRIRADNTERTDVERKSGLIIWSGRKLTLHHDQTSILCFTPQTDCMSMCDAVSYLQLIQTRRCGMNGGRRHRAGTANCCLEKQMCTKPCL